MEGPRPPSEHEFPQVVEFLNKGLRKETEWSIAAEYPTALNPNNIHNMRIITEAEHILAHAVMRPLIVKTPRQIFKVGAIGSVLTKEDHRGQGLSTQIVQDCLNMAKAQMCDIAILWTNLFDYYRKFGFELAGSEVSIVFDSEFDAAVPGLKISTDAKVSPEAIARLYAQHTVSTVRTYEEFKKYLEIPQAKIYTAWEADGTLAAYAIEGKGADLKGYVHEWGGSVSRMMALLSHIRKTRGQTLTLIVPGHAQNLIQASSKYTSTVNYGFLGMIKILNHDSFYNKIKRSFRSEGISDIVLEKNGGWGATFGCGNDLCQLQNESEVIRLLFGPFDLENLPQLKAETKQKISTALPLDFWLWGWDSI